MSKDNFDVETTKQLTRAQALGAMFDSSGWQVAEEELLTFIEEIKNIETIDLDNDPSQQIRDRKNLAEGLLEWVESLKSQVNNGIMVQEDYIDGLVERR